MSEITVTRDHQGKSLEASQGDVILVKLEENPTTGYRWAITEVDDTVLDLKDSDYSRMDETGIGGGGTRTLAFTAQSPGTTRIELQLRQEWDPENPEDSFEVTVQVQG